MQKQSRLVSIFFYTSFQSPPTSHLSTVHAESFKKAIKIIGAAIGAAAGLAISKFLSEKRRAAAGIELSNFLVGLGDPTALTRENVAALEAKYGASLSECCLEDVQMIYGLFLEAAIPSEGPLVGNEADLVKNFKAALNLSDIDAAPAHISVGQRMLRGRLETSSRADDTAARKNFQKLIYLSILVFGEMQASFLLRWKSIFGLNQAQVEVAKRDNAKLIFQSRLESVGLSADKGQLMELKGFQEQLLLSDDDTASVIQEAARKKIEAYLSAGIECIKRRSRTIDHSDAVAALKDAISFNRSLKNLAAGEDRSNRVLPAGISATSVAGSSWEAAEGRSRDLRDLFRAYVEAQVTSSDAYDDSLEADVADLRVLMGLGIKEAESIENEIKEKAYRKLLREEFTSGRLEAAASKAEVLGELVDKVRWDGEAAAELHKSLYRQKLTALLEKKSLTDDDAEELARLQRMLCVPNEVKEAMHLELCGAIYRDAVNQALNAGVEAFGYGNQDNAKKAFAAVRLDRSQAKTILTECARKTLMQYITKSRIQKNRVNSAKELKNMVLFSNIVVAPLVEDLKTEEERKAEKEEAEKQAKIQEMIAKAKEEAERKEKEGEASPEDDKAKAEALLDAMEAVAGEVTSDEEVKEEAKAAAEEVKPATLEKAENASAQRAAGEPVAEDASKTMRSQKDITLAADLDLRDRLDIYKNFLLYCMTGDVVQGPMGVSMVTQRDASEFARLSQLGDILGLSQMDVYQVHQGLAEQAFKSQVQSAMADGMLTPDRAASLEEMREKMGLPKEAADKIIKGFQNQRLIESMQAAKSQGSLSLEKILELKDSGVDVSSVLSNDMRQQLYRQEIQARMTDGTGGFDSVKLLEQLPEDLKIDVTKARKVAVGLAKEKRRTTLVQAVSYMRQKKMSDVAKSLNNLSAMGAIAPEDGPERWNEPEEVSDLYSIYASKEKDEDKRAGVARILGLKEEEAGNLAGIVDDGKFKLGQEAEEETASFF